MKKVPESERLALYDIYIARASEFFGIGKVSSASGKAVACQGHECRATAAQPDPTV